MRVLDLFACVGAHRVGYERHGFETTAMVELDETRRAVLARRFPGTKLHDDVTTYRAVAGEADIVIGGPPCQQTSVAAAIHGVRTGESLWPAMFRIGLDARAEWFVVEQPIGNKAWEAKVARSLSRFGYHVARLEFGACDVGAPYIRRRVYFLACASLPRLQVAWSSGPSAIERVKRAADARGAWDADKLAALRVDAQSSGEMDRSVSRLRQARIEALGDSNPPEMMEVIALCIREAHAA